MSTNISNETLADIVRDARELMNDSGAHWTQDISVRPIYDEAKGTTEYAYCSWGAVSDVASRVLGPGLGWDAKMAAMIELAKDDAVAAVNIDDIQFDTDPSESDFAYSKVVRFNDTEGRRWEEIDGVFRRTEERLRAEA